MVTKTYSISGMTCGGCKKSVVNYLNKVEGVSGVLVDLEKGEAQINSEVEISIDKLKRILPSKYTIESKLLSLPIFKENPKSNVIADSPSKLSQLKPLLLILFYVAMTAIGLNYSDWNWSNFMLDFMGLFFIVFSFFKFLDLSGFKSSFSMYDPLAKLIPSYGWIYPFIETGLGLMFLFRFETKIALILTIITLGSTTVGVAKVLMDKKEIKCACLGTVLKLPMTEATLIENTIMLVMASLMLMY